MSQRIVVVGCNAAGVTAASAARRMDEKAEIELIGAEPYPAYSRCGLPFVVGGEIPSFERLVIYPLSYYRMMRINLRTETRACEVDEKAKTVWIESRDKRRELIHYDKLVLATGADATTPPVRGREKEGVFQLRTIKDGETLEKAIEGARTAVVVGAGLIGLECSDALVTKGLKTTVVEMLPHVLPTMLDTDMGAIVKEKLEANSVRIITGKGIEEIVGGERASGVAIEEEIVEADIVLAATGVRANTELARQVGAELGLTRAIKVDERMETTVRDIYAAGDCVESTNLITGQPTLSQLGTNAVKQGYVAGTNAAGGSASFLDVLGSTVSKIFGLEVGATGLTEAQAEKAGLKTVSASLTGKTREDYFPGGERVRVKIVADPDQGRVLGCQMVGKEVAHRINTVAVAIQNRMRVRDLAMADTCYAPPVSVCLEPICTAAHLVESKLHR